MPIPLFQKEMFTKKTWRLRKWQQELNFILFLVSLSFYIYYIIIFGENQIFI